MATYGIDLGTTYSCISRLDGNGNPIIIRNQTDNNDTLASVCFFETADNVIVGDAAKEMIETDGDRVVDFVKRQIGKADAKTWEFFGKTYTAVDISALIVGRLIRMAEEQGEDVTDIVITCPAYFGLAERNATRQAGELALQMRQEEKAVADPSYEKKPVKVLDIINEPTAAALSYCARQFQEEKTIMVYDLGGGTFDVTLMKMSVSTNDQGEEVQKLIVVATGGNDLLGGKDWDDILYNHLEEICCNENGLTPEDLDPETRQNIRSKVEVTKRKLSTQESVKVNINVNGSMTKVVVTREEFEQATAGLVAQTLGYVDSVLKEAGEPQVDQVLLVGGSTFMPMISEAVKKRFEGTPVILHEPNLAVAKGAALHANMKVYEEIITGQRPEPPKSPVDGEKGGSNGGENGGGEGEPPIVVPPVMPTNIEDQLPRSFGPGVLNEKDEYIIDNLVKKGTVSPADVERTYYTPRENMTLIRLKVFESMSMEDMPVPCEDGKGKPGEGNPLPCKPEDLVRCLGALELGLQPGTPAGSPIQVFFHADMMGIHVRAVDQLSGKENEVTIRFVGEQDTTNSPVKGLRVEGE